MTIGKHWRDTFRGCLNYDADMLQWKLAPNWIVCIGYLHVVDRIACIGYLHVVDRIVCIGYFARSNYD